MTLLTGILKFAYDLLIGDSWALTLTVALVLGAGIAVAETGAVPAPVIGLCTALAILAAAPLVVIVEAVAKRCPPGRLEGR